MTDTVKTLVIDNFRGQMSDYLYGDINSGFSYYQTVAGQNPFLKPGQLTWSEKSVQIDPAGSVITDMILAMKERVEGNIIYVYAIGHTGRLYKIQVNDPTTYNPDYDNPILLTTLTVESPTFTRGGFMDFFGSTERIYIGHDKGVTRVDFAGTNETFVGAVGSWTQTVPRPLKQFLGKLYVGNGTNLAEIDSTATVTTYAKLSPAFPSGTQVRDLDLSPDGNYLDTVSSYLGQFDITSSTQEVTSTSNSGSFIFKWNGIDAGYTSSTSFPSFGLVANTLFQDRQFTFGVDQFGTAVYNPNEKILYLTEASPPLPNSIISTGNLLYFLLPVHFDGVLEADLFCWGSLDHQVGNPFGWWDTFYLNATSPETDILRVPCLFSVSNTGIGSSSNGYANQVFGTSKMYFSTLETSASTTAYRLYKWKPNSSLDIPTTEAVEGYYQTQSQMFSKKILVKEVRIYGEPWVSGNEFTVDLIGSQGSDGVPIPGGSKTFTAGTNLTIGDDFAWYTPDPAPSYTVGVAITNSGLSNFTINKIEIDYTSGGK